MIKTAVRARALALALLCVPSSLVAAPDEAAFTRSIGLRDSWAYLTREVAWPAHWMADGSHFAYRKTVEGGFAFESVDAHTLAKAPAFDQTKLAAGLSAALGRTIAPLRLPFSEFDYVDGGTAIRFEIDEDG